MKPTQQQEKLKKQLILSTITITSMEYPNRTESWNLRPKGDGRSGPSVPLLPERNLTFWHT